MSRAIACLDDLDCEMEAIQHKLRAGEAQRKRAQRKTDEWLRMHGMESSGFHKEGAGDFNDSCRNALDKKTLGGIRCDRVYAFTAGRGRYYRYEMVAVSDKTVLVMKLGEELTADCVRDFVDGALAVFARECPMFSEGREVIGGIMLKRGRRKKLPGGGFDDPVTIARKNGLMVARVIGRNQFRVVSPAGAARW